ncbi:hypothetical protein H2203_003594 [Taxawa tesnikishii (nom. ined.)]|nr:hypothetical protein H2203_003594 [Dothideales sp. JES 119]
MVPAPHPVEPPQINFHFSSVREPQAGPSASDLEQAHSVPATSYRSTYQDRSDGVPTELDIHFFSSEDLAHGTYLREHMDSQRLIHLRVVAGLDRIKRLTNDYDWVRLVCLQSPYFEVHRGSDDTEWIHESESWEKWVLLKHERNPSAQNEGPGFSEVYRFADRSRLPRAAGDSDPIDLLSDEVDGLRRENEELRDDLVTARRLLECTEGRLKDMEGHKRYLEKRLKEKHQNLSKNIEDKDVMIEILQSSLQNKQQQYEDLRQEYSRLIHELETLHNSLEHEKQRLDDKEQQRAGLITQAHCLAVMNHNLLASNTDLGTRLANLTNTYGRAQARIESLQR